MNRLRVAFLSIALGCGGVVGELPRASDPDSAVRVWLLHRVESFAGGGAAYSFALDGLAFAKLKSGDCVEFTTDPGEHFLVLLPGTRFQGIVSFDGSAGETIAIQCHTRGRENWCDQIEPQEAHRAIIAGDYHCLDRETNRRIASEPPPALQAETAPRPTEPPRAAVEELEIGENELFSPADGRARIFVLRSGYVGREYMLPIIDSRVVGGLLPGSYVHVDVEPGTHNISGSFAGVDASPPLQVEVGSGDLFFVRLLRVYSSARLEASVETIGVEEGLESLRRHHFGIRFRPVSPPPVRVSRAFAEGFTPSPGRGLVYLIHRGMRRFASGRLAEPKLAVILNGYVAALMGTRTYTAFQVAPGAHSLAGVVYPTYSLEPLEFQSVAGVVDFFEVSIRGGGKSRHAPVERLDEAEARRLLRPSQVEWLEPGVGSPDGD